MTQKTMYKNKLPLLIYSFIEQNQHFLLGFLLYLINPLTNTHLDVQAKKSTLDKEISLQYKYGSWLENGKETWICIILMHIEKDSYTLLKRLVLLREKVMTCFLTCTCHCQHYRLCLIEALR